MFDPEDAAVAALAAYFTAALPGFAPTVEGWPEWEEGQTYNSLPTVSVTPMESKVLWQTPCPASQNNISPALAEVTYKMGDVQMDIQLDLWSPYVAQLRTQAAEVSSLLHNDLPRSTGLLLPMLDFHNAVLHVWDHQNQKRTSDASQAAGGSQRKTWLLKAHCNLLAVGNSPRQAVLSLQSTTVVGGIAFTETPIEVS